MTSNRQNDIRGLHITSSIHINWYQLGKHFAEQSSDSQADFLAGFAEQLLGLGHFRSETQALHIAEGLKGSQAPELLGSILCFYEEGERE